MKQLEADVPQPENEITRLSRLQEYEIQPASREAEFDRIAGLAADMLGCPGAFINFVEATKVFSKAHTLDYPTEGIPREKSLCAITILSDEPLVITDTHDYEELLQSYWTKGEQGIRFYAAVPLITTDGFRLGTLCVIDHVPRNPSSEQLRMLGSLAKMVMDKLESRVIHRKAIAIQTEYVNRTMHDLKNYVTNLMAAAALLGQQNSPETACSVSAIITRNTKRIAQRLDDVLNLSKIQHDAYQLHIERCELSALLDNVIENYTPAATAKQQLLVKAYANELYINGDCNTLSEVFENLLSNAIKYSYPGSPIRIVSFCENNEWVIGFHDQGQGLSDGDKERLFTRYAKLSAVPTGKETANGLGLAISKILIELNKGKLWAESDGVGKGASFFVSFPAVQG